MRISFLGLATSACVLAACSSKVASPDGGDSSMPGADADPDSKVPGADGNVDLRPLDCGINFMEPRRGSFTWDDSSGSGRSIGGDGTATLRSEGGITRLELAGTYRNGTLSFEMLSVTATLTGGGTLLAGTYVCGQDAVAGYEVSSSSRPTTCWASTPTADCPGRVASCTFTLADEIWPGCFDNTAKGTFSLTLTGGDAGTVTISNGTFDVPTVEPVPPS